MMKTCAVFVVIILHSVLSKSIPNQETAEVPTERSSVHFSYGVSPVQMFTVHQTPINKVTGNIGFYHSTPVQYYRGIPTVSHVGFVNSITNPIYVSVLNDPNIKSDYSFMFSSPHLVKFHNQNEAKIKITKTNIHVEALHGKFEDFIKNEKQFWPENFYDHTDDAKPLIHNVRIEVVEATTMATTQVTTVMTPSVSQENDAKMEAAMTHIPIDTLSGKFEDFVKKDPSHLDNADGEEHPFVPPIESVRIDVTEPEVLATTQASTTVSPSSLHLQENEVKMEDVNIKVPVETLSGKFDDFINKENFNENVSMGVTDATTLGSTRATTAIIPSSSQENNLKGDVEYEIDIRKDNE